MGTVAALWRYPIKSHGREPLASVPLIAGQTIPWDRHWAVTHHDTKFDPKNPVWVMCRNFMIGNLTPDLAGISARLDTDKATITLSHQSLDDITFRPDDPADVSRFLTWVTPLCPPEKRQPAGIVHVPSQGITDTDYPSVSIMNLASHAEVAAVIDQPFTLERWRGNVWLDGLEAWAERDWIGQTLTIGDAMLRVQGHVERCNHTAANTVTGKRDVDTLSVLRDNWNHQDFGVYAEVIQAGTVHLGDTVKVN